MSDTTTNIFVSILLGMLILCAIMTGSSYTKESIKSDCKDYGKAVRGDTVFICEKLNKDQK
jgi:hypothetical protein